MLNSLLGGAIGLVIPLVTGFVWKDWQFWVLFVPCAALLIYLRERHGDL